jgi:sulfur carrier protein ThiS
MEKGFTVKELIEELKCYEDDKKVWLSYKGAFVPVLRVEQKEIINEDDIVIG